MIQRIQSVYLLLVVCAVIAFIFIPFGVATTEVGKEILIIKNIMVFVLSGILISLIAIVALLLFRNRTLQLKIVAINILFSFVLIGLFLYGLTAHVGWSKYTFGIGAIIPIFILLFNVLAYLGIKNDDNLVKSMDRLR